MTKRKRKTPEREGRIALHTENEIIGEAGNFLEIKRYLAIGLGEKS